MTIRRKAEIAMTAGEDARANYQRRQETPDCINCKKPFEQTDIRRYFGACEVGPLCSVCDRIIKANCRGLPLVEAP